MAHGGIQVADHFRHSQGDGRTLTGRASQLYRNLGRSALPVIDDIVRRRLLIAAVLASGHAFQHGKARLHDHINHKDAVRGVYFDDISDKVLDLKRLHRKDHISGNAVVQVGFVCDPVEKIVVQEADRLQVLPFLRFYGPG